MHTHKEPLLSYLSGKKALRVLAVFVLSISVYINTIWFRFVYDDNDQIIRNPWITDFANLPEVFTKGVWAFHNYVSNYYRPMMHVMYMFNYHLFGWEPWGFHLVNVLLNATVCVLVFFVMEELVRDHAGRDMSMAPSAPFVAAVIFAVHPVHTETVSWVACVPEILYTFFYLLSFYLYMVSRREGPGHRNKLPIYLSAACFFAALLCKEPAVSLPIALFCYDYVVRRSDERPAWYIKRYLPYMFVIFIYLVLRFNALQGFSQDTPNWKLENYQYFINIFPLFVEYLEKLLLPINLSTFHVFHPVLTILDLKFFFSTVLSACFVICLIFAIRRRSMAALGLVIIAVPILPALYIPAMGRNVLAERYLYLPVFGFSMLVSTAISQVTGFRPALQKMIIMAALMVLVTVYAAETVIRSRVWKDNYTLWTETVKRSQDDALPHNFMAREYLMNGEFDKAFEECMTAVRLDPLDKTAYDNLGAIYQKRSQLDKAEEYFLKAISIDYNFSEAHCHLGAIYGMKGLTAKAEEESRIALNIDPKSEEAYNNLGILYDMSGRKVEAAEQFLKAVSLNHSFAEAHSNLGALYLRAGNLEKAKEQLEEAIRIDPRYARDYSNLGLVYLKLGMRGKASEQFSAALNLDPNDDVARNGLSGIQ